MEDFIFEVGGKKSAAIFSNELYKEYLSAAGRIGVKPVKNPASEQELLEKDFVTPEDIKRLETYTENYLCPSSANIYGIKFVRYAVRDFENGEMLFELKAEDEPKNDSYENASAKGDTNRAVDNSPIEVTAVEGKIAHSTDQNSENQQCVLTETTFEEENNSQLCEQASSGTLTFETGTGDHLVQNESMEDLSFENPQGPVFISERRVSYRLSPDILRKATIGATVEFKVGNQEIRNFRMIELHFFKDKLIKVFDFDFGFCIPNSLNSWEHIYEIPKFPPKMVKEMIDSPYETRSETFYFVEGKLVIHNKADYAYNEGYDTESD